MDILSYSGATTTLPPRTDDGEDISPDAKTRKALLHVGDIADWCIFSIEVRNTYGLPFEVTFERRQEGMFASCVVMRLRDALLTVIQEQNPRPSRLLFRLAPLLGMLQQHTHTQASFNCLLPQDRPTNQEDIAFGGAYFTPDTNAL